MSDEAPNTPPPLAHKQPDADKILVRAWERMFYYDVQANEARRLFSTSRYRIIWLTLASTVTAVFAAWAIENKVLYTIMTALALALPILAGASVNIAQQFERVSAWLKHRLVAERIRAEIYLYRMHASEYSKLQDYERDDKLGHRLAEIESTVETDDFHATGVKKDAAWIDDMYADLQASYQDDGHQQLSVHDFLRIRGKGQRDWYLSRIERDYRRYRFFNISATFVQMSGGIFVALIVLLGIDGRYITAPTLTNALGFAITAYVNVLLTGQIYGVFNVTRKELDRVLDTWDTFQNNPEAKDEALYQAKVIAIVETVEEKLAWEREEWYRVAFQTLSSNDENLFKAVDKLQKESEKNGK